jgi:hypothetical protein
VNRQQHDVLKYIYERNEVKARAVLIDMDRRYNDHRDFYPLAALLIEGYIGFTGPIPKASSQDGASSHIDAYYIVRLFQCYSKGPGPQSYDGISIFIEQGKDSAFFIAAKGLIYFHERNERRKEWWTVAGLGLVSAIIAGCATGWLASTLRLTGAS